jgi:hypothetical protein
LYQPELPDGFCKCGWQIDDVPGNSAQLRRQERISTIINNDLAKSGPIVEAVKSETKDKLRATAHSKVGDIGLQLKLNEAEYLRAEGIQIKSEETKSSVTGHRNIKKYNSGKRKREREKL